ncbi:hypothetical protein GCK72_022909 [Caenorhabditis remanei]|nr:hypothetical protein GCK72_022909 [Caenorhabditis remanei]KAF1746453.1 hypothetical protein GCK72_022909 [Caenorhabditis remanei]
MPRQSHRSIKQEAMPWWEQPLRVPLPDLPPEDPTRMMTTSQYAKIAKNPEKVEQSWANIPDNEKQQLAFVILNEISNFPINLDNKNGHAMKKCYSEVAVKVYHRTGRLLSVPAVTSCFRNAKEQLRSRLKSLIQKKKLPPAKVEDELLNWPFYGIIRFYRPYTQDLEMRLRRIATMTRDGAHIVFDVSDDEGDSVNPPADVAPQANNNANNDVIVDTASTAVNLKRVKQELVSRHRPSRYSFEPIQEPLMDDVPYQYQGTQYSQQTRSPPMQPMLPIQRMQQTQVSQVMQSMEPMPMQATQQMQPMMSPPQIPTMGYGDRDQLYPSPDVYRRDSRLSSSSQTSQASQDVAYNNLQDDLKFFHSIANRVAKKDPARIEKMREVLSATMLSFEWKQTENLGDFFEQLGRTLNGNRNDHY